MSGSSNQEEILDVARVAGWAAARLCRAVQDSMAGEALYKDAREPVTVADYGSQAVILEAVSRVFPTHGVVSEEGAEHLRREAGPELQKLVTDLTGEVLGRPVEFDEVCSWIDHDGQPAGDYTWVIDPIDGTKGFLRGDQYAVAIGVLRDLEPWAGVLACPNLPVNMDEPEGPRGVLFVGRRGEGVVKAALDSFEEESAVVNPTTDAGETRILGSVESAHGDPKVLTALIERLDLGGGIVRLDSQAKYGAVAAGDAEIYLRPQSRPDYRERIWDHAAGVLLVEEAGGRVTDLYGRPLDFTKGDRLEDNRGIVATNGLIHDQVIEALGEMLGPPE